MDPSPLKLPVRSVRVVTQIGESSECGITAPPITLRTARQAASLEANVNFEWIGITKSKWQQRQFHLGLRMQGKIQPCSFTGYLQTLQNQF